MDRLMTAYLLIGLIIASLSGLAFHLWYNSWGVSYRRRQRRDRVAYEKVLAEQRDETAG